MNAAAVSRDPAERSVLVFDFARGENETARRTSYGLDVLHVQYVIEFERGYPVPLAPAWVRGITNHKGRIVTIVDPFSWLDEQPQPGQAERAIVLRRPGSPAGAIALQVGDVSGVVAEEVLDPHGSEITCVDSVGLLSERPVRVLNVEALLARLFADFASEAALVFRQGVDP